MGKWRHREEEAYVINQNNNRMEPLGVCVADGESWPCDAEQLRAAARRALEILREADQQDANASWADSYHVQQAGEKVLDLLAAALGEHP